MLIKEISTLERAEVNGAAVKMGDDGCPDRVDRHPTDGVYWQTSWPRATGDGQRDYRDRRRDVLERLTAAILDAEGGDDPTGRVVARASHEDLARVRRCCYPRSKGDGCAVPVAIAIDRRARVHSDANGKRAVRAADLADDPDGEGDGAAGLGDPDHDGIADALLISSAA